MQTALNDMTTTEILAILSGITVVYVFSKNIIAPLVAKWLKIDKTEHDLKSLQSLPDRIEALEEKTLRDYNRLNAMDDVNVLMMEALRALIRNRRTNNDVANLKAVEDKLDGFLVGKVRSE